MSLKMIDISHRYIGKNKQPGPEVLNHVTVSVESGAVVAVIGKSGCGKTTLLNIAAGLIKPSDGVVSIAPDRNGRDALSYAFQDARLLPWRTVEDNLTFALRGYMPGEADARRARARHYLELVNLSDYHDWYPSRLSGGMRQRVAIARALSVEPNVLLMDEPFSSLDEFTARSLRRDFSSLARQLSQSVLLITHNIAEAAFLADTVVVLGSHPGRVLDTIKVAYTGDRTFESPEAENYQRQILASLQIATGGVL